MAINAKVDSVVYEGIEKITTGGKTVELSEVYSGSQSIVENGTYDIGGKAQVVVNVPTESVGGSEPTGSINITTNGTHDVSDYAQAVVNVPQEGYDVDDIVNGSGVNASGELFYKAENVETSVEIIRKYAFAGRQMYKVTAPNVKTFSLSAFMGCPNLTEVDAPELTTINGANVFNGCTSLAKGYFPKLVNIWSNNTDIFNGCTNLADVNLDKCPTITSSMFYNCKALQTISLPAVTDVKGTDQFTGCTSLQNFSAPLMKNGAQNMFKNCTSLEEISLPSATGLGINMFSGCTALKKVDLGVGVTGVYNGIFANCTALETVILRYNGVATNQNKTFNPSTNGVTVYVPSAQLEGYRAASDWAADTKVTFAAIEGSEYE